MPTPIKGENKNDFIDRCMGDPEANNSFPDSKQRYAFCNSQWDMKTFELKINPENGSLVTAVALVDEPAIESDFIAFVAFSKEQLNVTFALDSAKHEILGAALIPNLKIPRLNPQTNEPYYVFFSVDTVRQIAQEFFKNGFQNDSNIGHTSKPAGSFIFQSYIVDEQRGMMAPKGLKIPDGSWVIGQKVENEATWNEIQQGKVKGFSVEGVFQFFEKINKDEQILQTLNQILEMCNNE